MTDSATGGFLTPSNTPAPAEGDPLNIFVQQFIVGITGMRGDLVRPSFQAESPDLPDAGQAFCAFRYTAVEADTYPAIVTDPATGIGTLHRHEDLEILASFYDLGTSGLASYFCALLRDGLAIPQNLEILNQTRMGLIAVGDMQPVPVLLKQRWMYRVDLPFGLRREVVRTYPVQSLLSAPFLVTNA